ncbi:hypothetical protein HYPSUDRAFT_210458, partial [Hypholoma sublateritium FD-334 SS-4]
NIFLDLEAIARDDDDTEEGPYDREFLVEDSEDQVYSDFTDEAHPVVYSRYERAEEAGEHTMATVSPRSRGL